jgi:hypothetical protein
MTIHDFIRPPSDALRGPRYCAILRQCFLAVAFLCLAGQVLYDRHPITVVSLFPQWLLLGAIWYSWRQSAIAQDYWVRGTLVFALLIPALSCLALLVAWFGWKANSLAIGGIIPISDSASYYISAQTFLREAFFDASGQRRPLNIVVASLWLYLSGDDFKLLLLIQALGFATAAFLASTVVAAMHGFRAGLLLFAFLLVFAEPYLPTMLSETNGIIFGMLALVGFLFGLYRGSFVAYWFGALFLAVGLAIRPSAVLVLPCIVLVGAIIFRTSRVKRLVLIASLAAAVLIPSVISLALNNSMSHRDGALNSNLSYVIYGLVAGGRGWEQYQKDNPGTLDGLTEAEQSRIVLRVSWQHFKGRPVDLVRGLVKGQVLGPLQTLGQIARLAFLGAAGDPLRIIPPAAVIGISLSFAVVLGCQLASKRHVLPATRSFRVFGILFLIGYLISIPFFYIDGGLRLHAAVLPVISYMLVWVLLPAGAGGVSTLSSGGAGRVVVATAAFGFALLVLLGWISVVHPKSREFDPIPVAGRVAEKNMIFRYKSGWPQCDLRNFEGRGGDNRPHWFSGAIPDDNYRSAGIREIAGQGRLYFGFDEGAGLWKIVHTDQPIGLLNRIRVGVGNHDASRNEKYRDFYSAEGVQVIGATSAQ